MKLYEDLSVIKKYKKLLFAIWKIEVLHKRDIPVRKSVPKNVHSLENIEIYKVVHNKYTLCAWQNKLATKTLCRNSAGHVQREKLLFKS